jgi:MFS family permease
LGILIAAWGLGGLISSPMFGYFSHKIGKIKPLLYVGFAIMFFGNLVYVFTGVIPVGKKYLILVTRFTTGFGLCTFFSIYHKSFFNNNIKFLSIYKSSSSICCISFNSIR